jgi:predicted ArsR family transcriptional regulator
MPRKIIHPWLFSEDRPLPAAPSQPVSATSRAAAAAAEPRVESQAARVLRALREAANGLTREQVAEQTGISLQAVCARCGQLLEAGLIRSTGMTRQGRYGRSAEVLMATGGRS